ncbi:hypothetical protein [Vannielia sp.]|uniref:NfeD family protein n=1 Tax=Vannielia sp. TaxID=2813045 RepID=UPI002625045C|nr:hypothetical protein [Vannielia sp.]MDF1873547.1 hypothetical protein [Vannielia sp.]
MTLASLMTTWWAWIALGVLLGILEVLAPGFIFVGFAVGAGLTGVLLALGISFGGSIAWITLFFAVVSLIAWAVLYKVMGGRGSQTKTFDEDINEG